MAPDLAAVSFDLDYTLAVPDRDRATLLRAACAAVDAPPLSREDYLAAHARHLTGETRTPIFEALLAEAGATDVSAAALARAYRERVTEALRPVPGAESLLATLRDRYRVALLTNGPTRAQRAKLEHLGWTDAFDAVLISGELPAGKPHLRAFAALREALRVPPGRAAHVGDDPEADVGGAHAAGFRPVQVLDDRPRRVDHRADVHLRRGELAASLPAVLARL
jgi:putative hydrolase of the HAD superfamily